MIKYLILVFCLVCFNTIQAFSQERTALLIIDVQDDFTRLLDEKTSEEFLLNINKIIKEHRQGEVIFIQANIRMLTISFRGIKVVQSENLDLDKRLNIQEQDSVWMKNEASAFSLNPLTKYLDSLEIKHVFLCGMYGEDCIRATAMDALDKGYDVTMVWDAILFKKEKNRKKLMKSLE